MASRQEKNKRQKVSAKKWANEHESGFSSTSLKVPEGVNFFSFKKAGTYKIDIIPFTAGEGNPNADEGTLHYERTYFSHRNIGPNEDTYVCPAKTFGKKCPICEARAKLARDPDSDEEYVKSLKPKERQLWNVFDHSEPDKGVQILDYSDWLFGKHLRAKINNADSGDGYELFADPDDGFTLKIGATEEKSGGYTFRSCTDIEFKARKEPLSDEVLNAATCLDKCLIEMDYAKLKAIFNQEDRDVKKDVAASNGKHRSADDDDDTPPKRPAARKPTDDDDDDDKPAAKPGKKNLAEAKGLELGMMVKHDDHGTCTITKVSRDGTSLTLEDEDGDIHTAIGPDEVEPKGKTKPADDDDDEPAPKARGKTADPDPDDDDNDPDDSDLDDDEPAKKPARKPARR